MLLVNYDCWPEHSIPLPHGAVLCLLQSLSLDSDSNLWVAGGGHVTKVFTAGITAGADAFTADLDATTGLTVSLATSTDGAAVALSLVDNLGTACDADLEDGCCAEGNFDAGIAITRDVVADGASFKPSNLNTIYVANTCATGLVRAFCQGLTQCMRCCGIEVSLS